MENGQLLKLRKLYSQLLNTFLPIQEVFTFLKTAQKSRLTGFKQFLFSESRRTTAWITFAQITTAWTTTALYVW